MQYEKLAVWQRSKQMCVEVYRQFSSSRDFGFRDQITRSALSICSNIAEGMEYTSRKEKSRYLNVAKASSGEFKTQVIVGKEIGYIPAETANRWVRESEELGRMLGGFINNLRTKTRNSKLATRN